MWRIVWKKKCRSLMRWREFKSFRMMFWQRSKWRFRDRQSVCFPTRTGIATLLGLDAEQTRMITPIAKSLIGKRSAVVLKTPGGNIRENLLPAGKICLHADQDAVVDLDEGAEKIMQVVSDAGTIYDMEGEHDTNVGNMFSRIKQGMEIWMRLRRERFILLIFWQWIRWHRFGFPVPWQERPVLRKRSESRRW